MASTGLLLLALASAGCGLPNSGSTSGDSAATTPGPSVSGAVGDQAAATVVLRNPPPGVLDVTMAITFEQQTGDTQPMIEVGLGFASGGTIVRFAGQERVACFGADLPLHNRDAVFQVLRAPVGQVPETIIACTYSVAGGAGASLILQIPSPPTITSPRPGAQIARSPRTLVSYRLDPATTSVLGIVALAPSSPLPKALALVPDTPQASAPELRGWHLAALRGLGWIAQPQGDYRLAEHVTIAALAAQRALGDDAGAARSLNMLAILAREQGQHAQAQVLWEQSLVLRRQVHDDNGIGLVLSNLATVAHEQGAYAEAARRYEESLRYVTNPGAIAITLNNWGLAEGQRGHYARAMQLVEEALAGARALGETLAIALALHSLGELARQQGDPVHALAYCDEGLRMAREQGDDEHITTVLMTLHALAVARGDTDGAEDLRRELTTSFAARLQMRRRHGDRQGIAETVLQLGRLARHDQDWEGALTYLEEAVALFHALEMAPQVASCLEELACVAVAHEACEQAVRFYGVAQGIRERCEAPLAPVDARHYRTLLAPAWTTLGNTEAADLVAQGRAAPWQAIAREVLGVSFLS